MPLHEEAVNPDNRHGKVRLRRTDDELVSSFHLGETNIYLGLMDELTYYFSGFKSNRSIPKRTPVINCTCP